MRKEHVVSVRVPADAKKSLDLIKKDTGKTLNLIINHAINHLIKDYTPPQPQIKQCRKCLFWIRQGSYQKMGECRRYPPMAGYSRGSGGVIWAWPKTSEADRCGEWRERPNGRRKKALRS